MSNLQIEFINSVNDVYFPGQIVDGRIVLDNRDSIKSRFLKVCIHGSAETHWSESERRCRSNSEGKSENFTEHVHYSSKIMYLEAGTVVWNSTDASNRLPPGQLIFPFRFQLPIDLPPSFEGFHGHIRYSVYVELDRVWNWNKKSRKCFSVVPMFDLNMIPQAINPMVNTISKNMGMIFKKGIISMTVNIPKRGFVAGENIAIQVNIENMTKLQIIQVRAKLVQLSSYEASRHAHHGQHSSRKSEDKMVAENRNQLNIPAHSKHALILPLRVPAVVPSFGNCPIISVEYFLSVKIDVNKLMGNTLKCEFPIIIGTIPLRQAVVPVQTIPISGTIPHQNSQMPSTSVQPPTAPPITPTNEASPTFFTENPPSYEESMNNTVKGDFEPFAPRYPVYNNLPSAPPLPEKM